MRRTAAILIVLTLLLLPAVACGSASAVRIGPAVYPATRPSDVIVFLRAADVERPFEAIGFVSAEKTAGWTFTTVPEEKVVNMMRKKAAKMGADTIILETLSGDSVPWAVPGAGESSSLNRKSARATAIKFKSASPNSSASSGAS